jgi:prevent-host-death family protein
MWYVLNRPQVYAKDEKPMKVIGIRELRDHLSEVIQQVEDGEIVAITKHGRIVARIVPVPQEPNITDIGAILSDLDALAARIGSHWQKGRSALDAIHDVRREL